MQLPSSERQLMGVVGAGARMPIHDEAKARESIRATGGAEPRVQAGTRRRGAA